MFYFWNGKGNYTKNDFLCIKQGIIIGGVSLKNQYTRCPKIRLPMRMRVLPWRMAKG